MIAVAFILWGCALAAAAVFAYAVCRLAAQADQNTEHHQVRLPPRPTRDPPSHVVVVLTDGRRYHPYQLEETR